MSPPIPSSRTYGFSELPSGFLGSVLDLRREKVIGRLVLEIGPLPVGATSSQLMTMGISLLPPGFLHFLLEM